MRVIEPRENSHSSNQARFKQSHARSGGALCMMLFARWRRYSAGASRCSCFSWARRCWCNRVPLLPFNGSIPAASILPALTTRRRCSPMARFSSPAAITTAKLSRVRNSTIRPRELGSYTGSLNTARCAPQGDVALRRQGTGDRWSRQRWLFSRERGKLISPSHRNLDRHRQPKYWHALITRRPCWKMLRCSSQVAYNESALSRPRKFTTQPREIGPSSAASTLPAIGKRRRCCPTARCSSQVA